MIPADRYRQPYMPLEELRDEIAAGVRFWGLFADDGALVGVMGIQDVDDVTLIRHAYVCPALQRGGVGGRLLGHLLALAEQAPAAAPRSSAPGRPRGGPWRSTSATASRSSLQRRRTACCAATGASPRGR